MRIEPNADMRLMAVMFYQMFIALQQEGFTEPQAMKIIGYVIAAQFKEDK